MHVEPIVWIITCVVVLGFFVFDFVTHVRTPHEPTIREAAIWSCFYIGLSVIFGIALWYFWPGADDPHQYGVEFFAGYVTEKALSVDNLFIFALIMTSFAVPRIYQQKVLLIGIAIALVLRGIFIGLGAAAINQWSAVFYLFGLFILYTAVKILVDEIKGKEEQDPHDMLIVKAITKVIPVAPSYDGDRLTTKVSGKRAFTPLAVALVAIGFVDVLFALDSIPAIYGLTSEPYIVFTANALALMGLRQLYFLLDGLMQRLVFLPFGLAVILGFIGIKLVLHALHENTLPFINGGEHVSVPDISTWASLAVIIGVLAVTTIVSLWWSNRHPAAPSAVDGAAGGVAEGAALGAAPSAEEAARAAAAAEDGHR